MVTEAFFFCLSSFSSSFALSRSCKRVGSPSTGLRSICRVGRPSHSKIRGQTSESLSRSWRRRRGQGGWAWTTARSMGVPQKVLLVCLFVCFFSSSSALSRCDGSDEGSVILLYLFLFFCISLFFLSTFVAWCLSCVARFFSLDLLSFISFSPSFTFVSLFPQTNICPRLTNFAQLAKDCPARTRPWLSKKLKMMMTTKTTRQRC